MSIIRPYALQSYSIYAAQQHPLARLWDVEDTEVPELLKIERNLISIDELLRPILEQDDFISSFGGTYINIFENHIVVNTVNYSKVDDLLALPQIISHEAFLHFNEANNSMKFINATKPFNPKIFYADNFTAPQNITRSRYVVNSRNLKVKVLGGDGLYNDGLCSVGFWAADRIISDKFYIITAGHCTKVIPAFSIRNDDADQYKELIVTDGAPVSSVGGHICKSGYNTHFSCEYVFGVNGIYVVGEDLVREDLIITDLYALKSDSGATVLSYGSPQNLHSVVGHGIIMGGGTGIAVVQLLDTIFNELEILSIYLKLYLKDSESS
ncbi:hypothetical protein C2G38_2169069 [Gigaspora rosea]|uniref:Peptidase S1 domain-containing protein n=1 Tax=Gigaspora rosea TaxID=44941 RepID=A0A397VQN5_9GLOM|nr:hypothetical protein C2G38_2169069 [Gigaspora rosea]